MIQICELGIKKQSGNLVKHSKFDTGCRAQNTKRTEKKNKRLKDEIAQFSHNDISGIYGGDV